MTIPSKESRDAALARVSPHDYGTIDEFIAAIDKLARYIEHGQIDKGMTEPPKVTSSVTNVMNVR